MLRRQTRGSGGIRAARASARPMDRSALVESWKITAKDGVLLVEAHLGLEAQLLQRIENRLEVGLFLELGFVIQAQVDIAQHLHHAGVAQAALHLVEHLLVLVQVEEEGAQFGALQHGFRAVAVGDADLQRRGSRWPAA